MAEEVGQLIDRVAAVLGTVEGDQRLEVGPQRHLRPCTPKPTASRAARVSAGSGRGRTEAAVGAVVDADVVGVVAVDVTKLLKRLLALLAVVDERKVGVACAREKSQRRRPRGGWGWGVGGGWGGARAAAARTCSWLQCMLQTCAARLLSRGGGALRRARAAGRARTEVSIQALSVLRGS
eukprot:SAG11_NODE_410_length_9703_cov_3.284777_2_plen_180_part_00